MKQSEGREFTKAGSAIEFTRAGSGIAREAPLLVSCVWCERIHPGEHPLSVCPACTARYPTGAGQTAALPA